MENTNKQKDGGKKRKETNNHIRSCATSFEQHKLPQQGLVNGSHTQKTLPSYHDV